jgi:hypothetical protein
MLKSDNKSKKFLHNCTNEAISFNDISLGMIARIQRVLQQLTPQDVADLAGVYEKDVELFESNLSLSRATDLKLLKAYNTIIEANLTRVLA